MAESMPFLHEHEGVAKDQQTGASADYIPTPAEEVTIKQVKKILDRNKRYRARYDEKWLEYYQFFRGKQWPRGRPSYRHQDVYNLVFRAIQSQVPIMTDTRPRATFLPKEPADREFADIINDLYESDWDRNTWLAQTTAVAFDGHFYGIGYSYEGYDAEADQGLGSADYCCVDPFFCYPDPDAKEINGKDSSSFCFVEPKFIPKLKAQYPAMAEYIRSDVVDFLQADRTAVSSERVRSPVDNRLVVDQNRPRMSRDDEYGMVITCYWKPEDTYETDVQGEDGQIYKEQRLKYPNGRKVVMQNDIILEDIHMPYDDGEFPYSRYVNYVLPHEYYGISEVENLKAPQVLYNKVINFILDTLTLMGNPIWVIPSTSGIDPESVFSRPGDVLEPEDDGAGIRRLEGVQLQPYVIQLGEIARNLVGEIAGDQDVTRGVNPTGITAASAIEQLQDAAQTRLRQKMRNLDMYLQSVGRHWLSRVLQFYTASRVHRVVNQDGIEKYFRLSMDTNGQGKKVVNYSLFKPDMLTGKLMESPMRQIELQSGFDITVVTGSALPFAKAEKETRMLNLFDRGIIDAEEVLKGLDYPNAEAVLARVQERQQQAAAAAQQQGSSANARPNAGGAAA